MSSYKRDKLLFINNMAAPYQVKFCYALQEYYDTEMWFYTHIEKNRPDWWSLEMGEKCRVMEGSRFLPILNYGNPNLLGKVKEFDPNIILAGGLFFPSQYRVKRWAIKNNVKYIALSEQISFKHHGTFQSFLKKIIKKIMPIGWIVVEAAGPPRIEQPQEIHP